MEVIEVAGKLLGLAVADLGTAAESASDDEDTCWSREGSGASYEGGASEDEDGVGGKRKRMSADDRKARNRERNRLHARKTRQRKKQHVQELQLKIWGLRQDRQRLLQLSTEHRTAGVLLALSCSPKQCVQGHGVMTSASSNSSISSSSSSLASDEARTGVRPQLASNPIAVPSGRDWSGEVASHEEALRKITQEFESMDGSQQIGDEACGASVVDDVGSGSGGRGGSGVGSSSGGGASGGAKNSRGGKGTLADRTALRRERNRMHAKRTRNRKKLFVEACSVMIDKMKVENAQLEHEIRASGIRLPRDSWMDDGQETVPEEPLPEYLAALWDFAEGKSHCPKVTPPPSASSTTTPITPPTKPPPAPKSIASRTSRQNSSTSTSSMASSSRSARPATAPEASASPAVKVARSNPGQALEDASTLCAFMEAAQTRSAKRVRVRPSLERERSTSHQYQAQQQQHQQQQPRKSRVWSDHGSTTSESRGSSESDDEIANERKSATEPELSSAAPGGSAHEGGSSGGDMDAGATLSPAFWTSRQVMERYAYPRQVC